MKAKQITAFNPLQSNFVVSYGNELAEDWLDETYAAERHEAIKTAFKSASRDIGHKFVKTAYAFAMHVYNDAKTNPAR